MQANPPILTDEEKMKKLHWYMLNNASNAVFAFLTMFGPVFTLFLDAVGFHKGQIGYLLSFMPFCGILALFLSSWASRFGLKKTFVLFYTIRKFVVACLLFTPVIKAAFGLQAVFLYVATCVLLFAICRAIAETAVYPWIQQIIPNHIRGRNSAVVQVVCCITGSISYLVAGCVIKSHPGLSAYMILFAVGVVFGLLAIGAAMKMPGGAPVKNNSGMKEHFSGLRDAIKDRKFTRYLSGLSLIVLSNASAGFIPLYLKEQIGIGAGTITALMIASNLGTISVGYFWGSAADKLGCRKVLGASLLLMASGYVLWMLVPRHSYLSLYAAALVFFLNGAFIVGWQSADSRLLYVRIVPENRSSNYMAVYYAWMGIIGGLGPLMLGQLLEATRHITGRFLFFTLDGYTPMLVFAGTAACLSAVIYTRLKIPE